MSTGQPLTIAIVAACPFPWPRGTPIRAYRIAEALSQLGHVVHVITYHLGEELDYPFQVHRIENVPGYQRTSAGPSVGKICRLNPALVRLSRQVSADVEFDVVHAMHMEGLLVAKRAMPDLPIVYDAHTSLTGELPDYVKFLPRRLVSLAGAYLDRMIPAKADFTIAVSEKLKHLLVDYQAVCKNRIDVIPNGVEYELFQPLECAVVDGKQILFTGNDSRYQRLDLLLDAFVLLSKVKPEARLTLTGSSTFALERAFVKDNALSGSVQIVTTTFSEELHYLQSAAIAVSPRTVCDGVPQKLLNYMAAGKAIVACEGSAVHLRHEETGIRVVNDDPQALADVLSRLIDDPQLTASLGAAAREEVRLNHSWQSVARKIQAIYMKTIEVKREHR